MAKYDDMSFSKAFAAARKEMGKGKTFTWKGKSYTTDLKEEAAAKKSKKKDSVPVPPPRPSNIGGAPIKEMEPSSTKSQRTMSMRGGKITETKLGEKKSSGRGDGRMETFTRRMQAAIDRPKEITYDEWKSMTRAERKKAGLPVSTWGGAIHAFKKAGGLARMSGDTKMAKGGMAKKG